MTAKDIAGLIPTMQSIALVSENVRVAKKKKVKTKDMMELGMKNIVGTSLIKVNADIIAGM